MFTFAARRQFPQEKICYRNTCWEFNRQTIQKNTIRIKILGKDRRKVKDLAAYSTRKQVLCCRAARYPEVTI